MDTITHRRVSPDKAEAPKLKRNTVGARIAKLRYQLGLTQDDVAKVANRGRSAVAQWERDDCEPPLAIIVELAKILETTPQFLAFGTSADVAPRITTAPSRKDVVFTLSVDQVSLKKLCQDF